MCLTSPLLTRRMPQAPHQCGTTVLTSSLQTLSLWPLNFFLAITGCPCKRPSVHCCYMVLGCLLCLPLKAFFFFCLQPDCDFHGNNYSLWCMWILHNNYSSMDIMHINEYKLSDRETQSLRPLSLSPQIQILLMWPWEDRSCHENIHQFSLKHIHAHTHSSCRLLKYHRS